jgi:hypothetical protein
MSNLERAKDDGAEVFPAEMIPYMEAEATKAELDAKIAEAKEYLDKTDHKIFPHYEEKADEFITDIIALRSVAREFIRSNKQTTEDAADPILTDPVTIDTSMYDIAAQQYVNSTITSLGYKDIAEVTELASYANIKQLECKKLLEFNRVCWNKAYSIKTLVANGEIEELSQEDFVAMLPIYTA